MSEELRTEEEQVEAIKNWWKENGKSLIVTIVIVLGGYLGWNGYQDNQRAEGEAASNLYQQLVNQATKPVSLQTESDKTELEVIATQLKEDFSGSLYAQFAGLYLAKFAIEAGDFDAAASELSSLLETADQGPITYLAQVRLARVFIQQGKLDEALVLVETIPEASFTAQYEEVKGDVLFAQGQKVEALSAYQAARVAATSLGINTQVLQRKIDDLAGVQANAEDA
jgi:predicted negative regulator of RcsB-dependent stress response